MYMYICIYIYIYTNERNDIERPDHLPLHQQLAQAPEDLDAEAVPAEVLIYIYIYAHIYIYIYIYSGTVCSSLGGTICLQ